MSTSRKKTREPIARKKKTEAITRVCTINLKKLTHKTAFKKKAPRAMKKIRIFAEQVMGTKDVRLDVKLNKAVWTRGIRSIPNRIRVTISRRRHEVEEAEEDFYSFVTVADDQMTKGKSVEIVDLD